MERLDKLNDLARIYLANKDWNLPPLKTIEPDINRLSITELLDKHNDVVQLNPITAGNVKQYHTNTICLTASKEIESQVIAVNRVAIGYAGMLNLLKNEAQFLMSMMFLINNVLCEFTLKYGNLSVQNLKIELIDVNDCFFKHCSESAAIEFRISLRK